MRYLQFVLKALGWCGFLILLAESVLLIWSPQVGDSGVLGFLVLGLINAWIVPISFSAAALLWQPVSILTFILWLGAGMLMRRRGAMWWQVALAGIPCAAVVSAVAHALGWEPPSIDL